jgi:hypothetical protein
MILPDKTTDCKPSLDTAELAAGMLEPDTADYSADCPLPFTADDERWLASLNADEDTRRAPADSGPATYRRNSWTATFNALFPDPAMPPQAWQTNVAGYLFERCYHASSIAAVLAWAEAAGSMECCGELLFDANDRAAVEDLLPDVPEGEWTRGEMADTWTIGG